MYLTHRFTFRFDFQLLCQPKEIAVTMATFQVALKKSGFQSKKPAPT
jgi:hypothetical protein